ncbi:Troponin C [Gurleya vavrai]
MSNYKSIFTLFANTTTNTVKPQIIPNLLRQAGHVISDKDAKRIIANIHSDDISYDEFIEIAEESKIYEIGFEKARSAFLAFDPNQTGYVNTTLLKSILLENSEIVSENEVEEMIKIMCKENTETFNYESFLKKMF